MARALSTAALLMLLLAQSAGAQQFARPDGTVPPAGGWSAVVAGSLWDATNDPNQPLTDPDYMQASGNTTDELTLTDLADPNVDTGHVLRFTMMSLGGGSPERVEVQLYQGTTQIAATGTKTNRTGSFSSFSYNVTAGDANQITNYNDLRVRVVSSNLAGGGESVRVGSIELEVPSVATVPPTVDTPLASAIETDTATLGATVQTQGSSPVTARGTVWNETGSPVIPEGQTVNASGGLGSFQDSVSGLPVGAQVFFRGYATNSTDTGYSADGSFYTEPNQATGADFTNVGSETMRVIWSAGGGDGTLVVMREGSAVDSPPLDGTPYTGGAAFQSGSQIGTGNWVIFSGVGTFVDVTGLTAETTYHVAIYEFAGSGGDINYQQDTPSINSQLTNPAGTAPTVDTPLASAIGTDTATLGATVQTEGSSPVTARGTVWNETGSPVIPEGQTPNASGGPGSFQDSVSGLPVGAQVFFAGYATNSTHTGYSADGSFYTEPNQATGADFTNVGSLSMRVIWSAGGGDGTLVVMREGSAVDSPPVDGTPYSGGAAFQSGSQIGTGNWVIFSGVGTFVDVTGLTANTTYHVAIYEFAGSGGDINYQQDTPSENSQLTTTGGAPPEPTSSPLDALISDPNAIDGLIELRISWIPGNGDGTIVVGREGRPVDADPVDLTAYTASATFPNGSEIGTGNFVVFNGSGTEVTVTVPQSDIPYHFKLYAYAGSGGDVDYRQTSPEKVSSGHNAAHSIECVECHFATGASHGGNVVPRDTDQETVCKGCHIDTGPASAKMDVALHEGPKYSTLVDCGSCHNVHNNFDFTTADTHSGGVTTYNVEWIRSNVTKYRATALEPALFQDNTGFFAFDDSSAPWNGICQTCHRNTDWHNNNAGTHAHEVTKNCTGCHTHLGNGTGGFTPTGGDCTGCHRQQQEIGQTGTYRRQITEGSAGDGTGEFSTDFTSHHVNDGTGSQVVTKWDCVVCHAEGDVLTGSTNDTYHQKDGVQLKNVDTGVAYADWSTLTASKRSEFCLSCHDSNGATIVSGRTDDPNEPDDTDDPNNPFNDEVANAHEGAGFNDPNVLAHPRGRCDTTKTIACADNAPCPTGESCQLYRVVDVKSQFSLTNASHHAVLGPAYGGSEPTPPAGILTAAITGGYSWTSTLECESCHYGPGSGNAPLSGHGTANARYMLQDSAGNDTLATGTTVVCYACHNPSDDNSNYDQHDQGNHTNDDWNLYSIGCLNCHGGGEMGGIHGVNAQVEDDTSGQPYVPNVFTYGAALDLISTWVPDVGTTVTCSAKDRNIPYLLSNCDRHTTNTYDRAELRDYRSP
jgi:hypothetical protein